MFPAVGGVSTTSLQGVGTGASYPGPPVSDPRSMAPVP